MATLEKELNSAFVDYVFDWNHYYYVVFGGYGSSKSYNTAWKIVLKLLQEKRTVLVVREVYNTHLDSTYSLLKEVVDELAEHNKQARKIKCTTSPLRISFPNGAKIIFRGLDDEKRLKSVNDVSIVWFEEATEGKFQAFTELTGRMRHPKWPLHMILTFNPVDFSNWVFKQFFKRKVPQGDGTFRETTVMDQNRVYNEKNVTHDDIYYMHSTVDDNRFVPASYVKQLDGLKETDIDLWRVARLGHFGANGDKVLPNIVIISRQEMQERLRKIRKPLHKLGFDVGFSNSYNAMSDMTIDMDEQALYIHGEYYTKGLTDPEIADDLEKLGVRKRLMKVDSADPSFIAYLQQRGFRVLPAKKFPGSRKVYTKKVRRFKKIYISEEDCPNHVTELKDLIFKVDSKTNEASEDEFNIDAHTFSSIWYGLDDFEVTNVKGYNAKNYN